MLLAAEDGAIVQACDGLSDDGYSWGCMWGWEVNGGMVMMELRQTSNAQPT